MSTYVILAILLFSAVLVVGALFVPKLLRRRKPAPLELLQAYTNAVASGDKEKAREAGRAYYASMRTSGVMTDEDEATLDRDIASMR